MGILDDLKATANVVGKMATDAIDISKLKITSAELESEISDNYEELGKIVYESKKSGKCSKDAVVNKVAQLDLLNKQLSIIKNQIAVLKNKIKCSKCGYDNDNKAIYCMKCGAKLEIANEESCCDEDNNSEVLNNDEKIISEDEKVNVKSCDCENTTKVEPCNAECDCGCNDNEDKDEENINR